MAILVLFPKSHKTFQDTLKDTLLEHRSCAPRGGKTRCLWDPIVKPSKGTEEFTNRLKCHLGVNTLPHIQETHFNGKNTKKSLGDKVQTVHLYCHNFVSQFSHLPAL